MRPRLNAAMAAVLVLASGCAQELRDGTKWTLDRVMPLVGIGALS